MLLMLFMWPAAEARLAPAKAGAWPLQKDTTLVITDFTLTRASRAFDDDGDTKPAYPFSKKELQIYAEHGWRDSVTLVGKTVWSHEGVDSPVGKFGTSGLRFIEAGARVSLGTVLDVQVTAEGLAALNTATNIANTYVSRSGDIDYEAALYLGRTTTLMGMQAFTDQRSAYRARPGGRADEISTVITTGLKPNRDWMLLLQSSNFIALAPDRYTSKAARAFKAHLSVVTRVSPILSVELGGYTTYDGRNTVQDSGIKLGFWYRF